MPPTRKRTTSKHTPPPPSTHISHTQTDQHHHLRHTGPSISTRSRVTSSSKPIESNNEITSTQTDHGEKKPSLTAIAPPAGRTSFATFIYALLFVVLLLFAWYIYGMVMLFERLKDEVGWWGNIVGNSKETFKGWGWGFGSDRSETRRVGMEGLVNALADGLGVAPREVASAVKPLIPEASLESMASMAEGTGTSEVVRILLDAREGRGEGVR